MAELCVDPVSNDLLPDPVECPPDCRFWDFLERDVKAVAAESEFTEQEIKALIFENIRNRRKLTGPSEIYERLYKKLCVRRPKPENIND